MLWDKKLPSQYLRVQSRQVGIVLLYHLAIFQVASTQHVYKAFQNVETLPSKQFAWHTFDKLSHQERP
jgi:hypothetical protein